MPFLPHSYPMKPSVRYLTACLLALYPALVLAQAAPPAPAPPPPAREGSVEFAFIGTTGNSSTQTIGVGGEAIVRPDQWVVRNRAAFIRNKSGETLMAESFQYLFRAERALSPRVAAFGEYTYFRDEFAGIEHRNAVVGGVSYKVLNQPAQVLSVDGGLGYLNEHRLIGPDVSSGTYSFGGAYNLKLSSTAELTDDFRFTGTFALADDWRVANIVAIAAHLTTLFSLKASHTVRHVNAPVPGFKSTDTNTAIALVAKF
jgi:putative salt-induced outer membrane protein YdiY